MIQNSIGSFYSKNFSDYSKWGLDESLTKFCHGCLVFESYFFIFMKEVKRFKQLEDWCILDQQLCNCVNLYERSLSHCFGKMVADRFMNVVFDHCYLYFLESWLGSVLQISSNFRAWVIHLLRIRRLNSFNPFWQKRTDP